MSDAFGSLDLFSAFASSHEEDKNTYKSTANGLEGEYTSEEVVALQEENERLRAHIRLSERFAHLFPCQTPVAEVDFFNSALSVECRARFEAELFTLLSEQRDDVEKGDGAPQGHVIYLSHYMLDPVGHFYQTSAPVQFGETAPLFNNLFNAALDDKEDKRDMFGAKLPQENMSSGPECFNCGGPHRLTDCKEPHDKKKIHEALKQFKDSRGSGGSNDRYHVRVVKEIETRFKEYEPGKVSDSLRSALGVEPQDLPPYIYRMRSIGYPPGYSLDPPLSNEEGMQFYYTPHANKEDGEVVDTPLPGVVNYPGYTAPLPPQAVDTHRARNMPYSAVTPSLSDKRQTKHQNKRRKLSQPLGESVKHDADDMDVAEDDSLVRASPARGIRNQPPLPPPVPSGTPPGPSPPPPSPPPFSSLLHSSPTSSKQAAGDKAAKTNTETAAPGKPAATSTPLPASKTVSRTEVEQPSEGDAPKASAAPDETPEVLNRSVVSETNKIGIKFDQTEDYGPLDERAGNFTKLQCILRSRKKADTPQQKTARTRSAKK